MNGDDSGHGMDHVERVAGLSEQFLAQTGGDEFITLAIAYLHDVDDYKLVGLDSEPLANAGAILDECGVTSDEKRQILDGVAVIGYSKRLAGIKPASQESAIVSDADMCDASGASGILRAQQYSLKYHRPFFVRDVFPAETVDLDAYQHDHVSTVNHLFEKILRLRGMMLTEPGRREAESLHKFVYAFLEQYFRENQADEWLSYLERYK